MSKVTWTIEEHFMVTDKKGGYVELTIHGNVNPVFQGIKLDREEFDALQSAIVKYRLKKRMTKEMEPRKGYIAKKSEEAITVDFIDGPHSVSNDCKETFGAADEAARRG